MKRALDAIAKLTDINIDQAAEKVHQNPLLEEEVHIGEELINLEEAIKAYTIAARTKTLQQYPSLKKHLLSECRSALIHSVGLVARMLKGNKLPHEYDEKDTLYAVQKIVQLVIADAQRTRRPLSEEFIEVTRPFMSFSQQFAYRKEHPLNPMGYIRIFRRRISALI